MLSSPEISTCPSSGCSSPAMTRSSVDLPLPLGPRRAVSPPSGTSMETSSSATKSPKRLVTFLTEMAMSGLLHRLWDEHTRSRQLVVCFVATVASRGASLEIVPAEQHAVRADGEHERGGIGAGQVEAVEFLADEESPRIGLAADAA